MFTSYIVFGRPNANSFMGNRLQGAPGQACPGVTQVPSHCGSVPALVPCLANPLAARGRNPDFQAGTAIPEIRNGDRMAAKEALGERMRLACAFKSAPNRRPARQIFA